MTYPAVLSEDETLDLVLAGRSLARIGDGELKLAVGSSCQTQQWNADIGEWMRKVAAGGGHCLAAIPNLDGHPEPLEKTRYWRNCRGVQFVGLYGSGPYGSSFISRPDCAPHIDRPDYWAKLRRLWQDRDIVLVRGSGKSLTLDDMGASRSCEEILAPAAHAWSLFEPLYAALREERRTVLLCLGPVATALAWRLSADGVHAVDLGAVGRFMRKSDAALL